MAIRDDLQEWVLEALRAHDGRASLAEVSKHVWENHGDELQESGKLLYTWQYDIRWAANRLRSEGKMIAANSSPRGTWELA